MLAFATKLLARGDEKTKSSQEAALDICRAVLLPLLNGLADADAAALAPLAADGCGALVRLAAFAPLPAAEPLFRLAAKGLEPAAKALAELELDAEALEHLLHCALAWNNIVCYYMIILHIYLNVLYNKIYKRDTLCIIIMGSYKLCSLFPRSDGRSVVLEATSCKRRR